MKKHLLLSLAVLALAGGAWMLYGRMRNDPPRESAPPAVDSRTLTRSSYVPTSLMPPSSAVPASSLPVTETPPIRPSSPVASVVPSPVPAAASPISPTPAVVPGTSVPLPSSAATRSDDGSSYPAELNLASVFYPQAPDADWSMPWQEACEEASILLVANTVRGDGWTRAQFRSQILQLVRWETESFGSYEHTTVDQNATILRDYLGLGVIIHENPSFEDVQRIIASGHFIVATFAGKRLGNPFYSNDGPNYHAMVIKGYRTDGQRVVTSDVGTKRGENYVYSWPVIRGALHDYAEPIEDGAKRFIEVLPPS